MRQISRRRRSSLELALRPLPGATVCGAIHALLVLVYSFELFAQRNELWAALVFIAAIVVAAVIWNGNRHTKHGAPRRLRLCSDGTARLFTGDGRIQRATVQPHSLRLGSYWLLVFATEEGTRHRLLLGPGNLQPAERAALGRWLRRPPADPLRLR